MSIHLDPHKDNHLWSQYLEGDLERNERDALESHLRECDICRREVQLMRQTVNWLSQLAQSQEIQAPADFLPKVKRRLRHKRHKRRISQHNVPFSGQNITTALIVATLLVVTFTLLFVAYSL